MAWKKTLGLSDPPLLIEEQGGQYTLRAQQVAGAIRAGSINIEIAPKFVEPDSESKDWRQAFWRILVLASSSRTTFGRASGTDVTSPSITDLLAELFLDSYERGAVRGMPLEYTEQSDVSVAPRGNLDVHRLDEWRVSPWRVPTVTDVLTDNTPVARLLGWTASRLRPLVVSRARARSLDGVARRLAGPGHIPSLMDAERLTLGAQHDGLRTALAISVLLLRGQGISYGDGNRDVIGFLWKTADVYERFLFWLCQRASPAHGLSVAKRSTQFGWSTIHGPLTTTPDVAFQSFDDRFIAVLDAKYKPLNTLPKAADCYQVLAAANTLGCSHVGLVYPASTPREESTWSVPSALGGKTVVISALFLDLCLAATVAGTHSLVSLISDWLARLADGSRTGNQKSSSANPSELSTNPS